jgi:hypothetical protein
MRPMKPAVAAPWAGFSAWGQPFKTVNPKICNRLTEAPTFS